MKAITQNIISNAFPFLVEGKLDNGKFYVIRFRWGELTHSIGCDLDSCHDDAYETECFIDLFKEFGSDATFNELKPYIKQHFNILF